jgi:hypothetical protein
MTRLRSPIVVFSAEMGAYHSSNETLFICCQSRVRVSRLDMQNLMIGDDVIVCEVK